MFSGNLGLVMGRGRPRLLKTLVDFPRREFSINELARVSQVPFATAWRAARDWEKNGLVSTRLLGRARLVRLANEKYASELMKTAFLPSIQQSSLETVREVLARERRVEKAFLFGSVAEGMEVAGSDLDVALLVKREFDAADLVGKTFDETGCKLVPLQFSSKKDFEEFLKEKKKVKLK